MSDELATQESLIHLEYLQINPVFKVEWLETCKALNTIISNKLYRPRYASLEIYLFERWNQSTSNGYRVSNTGKVLKELEQVFSHDQLPTSIQLCLAVKKQAASRSLPVTDVWQRILAHFRTRDNVVTSELNVVFSETEVLIRLSPVEQEPLPPTPVSPPSSPSSSTRSSTPTDGSQSPTISLKKRLGCENEFNSPAWLIEAIERFTAPDGIDLDPCTNTESILRAKRTYGNQADGTFINALTLEDWDESNWVYLNPPGSALFDHERGPKNCSNLISAFLNKSYEELEKGNIKRIIGIVPAGSARGWGSLVYEKSLTCSVGKKVNWQRTAASMSRATSNPKSRNAGDILSRVIFYMDSDPSFPYSERFVEVFGEHGFIPGYNMKCYHVE
ncbi:hypothetical protein DFS34DRAFT_650582 [Phlyctochytrium arcticum]|nr:hypothetical protein DFS34DRAFT_597663 [Phlyctochytrium arcticum]KAI9095494.1 hypothetical protein DFS34DRAFT_651296 [Phlyctochytrium arcticum]KAI9096487.1 hypothetical protein DFS34DRAFT_650582 [Phlyctochytrium arcticum]